MSYSYRRKSKTPQIPGKNRIYNHIYSYEVFHKTFQPIRQVLLVTYSKNFEREAIFKVKFHNAKDCIVMMLKAI